MPPPSSDSSTLSIIWGVFSNKESGGGGAKRCAGPAGRIPDKGWEIQVTFHFDLAPGLGMS